MTENQTVWKSDNQGDKEETFIQTSRRAEMGSRVERTPGKAAAGRPSKVADCGRGQARLQLANPTRWWLVVPAAPHSHVDKLEGTVGERSRPCNPGLQLGEIKPQSSD